MDRGRQRCRPVRDHHLNGPWHLAEPVTGASGHLGGLAVQQLLARGVQVRVADYSHPQDLGAALAGTDRLLLVSGNEAGRVTHHANVARAARTAGVSRIVYTSMLGAGRTSSPLVGGHLDSERAIGEAGVPLTALRDGLYLERYTSRLSEYLKAGEIVGAAGSGRVSPASRQDYAAAAVAALTGDDDADMI
jgi:NAD(P)H dehydrogenase (quinone)